MLYSRSFFGKFLLFTQLLHIIYCESINYMHSYQYLCFFFLLLTLLAIYYLLLTCQFLHSRLESLWEGELITVINGSQNLPLRSACIIIQFSSCQSLSCVWLFATPWTAARQASLSITSSWSLPKPMSIESVMPSNHLILCRPLLPPSIFPSIRVFSNESALPIRWPKCWSFSFNISPSPQDWSLGWTSWISLQSKGLSRIFSNTTVQKHQFFSTQLSL